MKFVKILLCTLLLGLCILSVSAAGSGQYPVVLCYAGDAYAVDYVYRVGAAAEITGATLHAEGALYDYNLDRESGLFYLSVASSSPLPKGEALVTLQIGANTQPALVSAKVNGQVSQGVFTQHTEIPVPVVPPGVETPGRTQGEKCAVCGYVMDAGEPILPTGPVMAASLSGDGVLTVTGAMADSASAPGITLLTVNRADGRALTVMNITALDQSAIALNLPNCTGASTVKIMRLDAISLAPLSDAVIIPVGRQ